ncbi:hypothetical protein ACQRIT_000489 [Beauveria bassiana]
MKLIQMCGMAKSVQRYVQHLRAQELEKLITIPQDPVFLPLGSTIAQNLDLFGAASRDQCQDILKHVGLWSMVQDHGGSADAILQSSTLSQGQRQLV